jgi:hypothetical protein
VESLANFLDGLGFAPLVNDWGWVWPFCEILHFGGMSLLLGAVGLLDARILGLARGIPIAALERLVPIGVAAFCVNLVTGFIFVAGNPIGGSYEYLSNLAFQIKMLLVLIAGINVLVFYVTGISRAAHSVGSGDAPFNAKVVAAASLALWFGVIVFGRLIMYNDTLLYALGL